MNGTIKMTNPKGFGFIVCEDGTEIFFHMSGLVGVEIGDLKQADRATKTPGDKVTFDIENQPDGKKKAVNVTRA